jgi:hypothetical protein
MRKKADEKAIKESVVKEVDEEVIDIENLVKKREEKGQRQGEESREYYEQGQEGARDIEA